MKICQKCGKQYTDDNMFCETCGEKLVLMENPPLPPNPKKTNVLLIVIPIVVVAVIAVMAVLLFVFKDKLPFKDKIFFLQKDGVQQELVQETMQGQEETSQEQQEEGKQAPEGKDAQEEQEEPKGDDAQKSYDDVQLNGVDNAYVEVSGVIAEEGNSFALQLLEASAVCAYDPEDKVIEKENVKSLALDGDDLEEYLGVQVMVKGKLLADISGELTLQVVNLEVEKEASQEEETDYQTHRYELILADVTWQEAFDDCKERGGYLLQINSEEELNHVGNLVFQAAMHSVHFYLGGRRDANSTDYYWINADNQFVGDVLNPEGDAWTAGYWMENEPSFHSDNEDEMYMNIVYYQEQWMLNDVSNDITVFYPGKTGYICEYDE